MRPRLKVTLERGPPLGIIRSPRGIVVIIRLDEEQPTGEGNQQRNPSAGEGESYSVVTNGPNTGSGQETRGNGEARGAMPREPTMVAQGRPGAHPAPTQRREQDAGGGTRENTRRDRDSNGSHAAIITSVGQTA